MSNDTITKADLARMCGKSRFAVTRQLRRHGVETLPDGTVNKAKALDAIAAGAVLDKNKAAEEIDQINASGKTESLVIRGRLASLRRIVLQGDLLEIERDKARGDLIPVSVHKDKLIEMQNATTRLMDVWIETISSKRRDADLAEDLRDARNAVLAEVSAIIQP